MVAAAELAAERLAAAGHVVESIPAPVDDLALFETFVALFARWVARDVDALCARTGRVADDETLEPMTLALLDAARGLTVDDITAAQLAQGAATHQLTEAIDGFDALLTPTIARPTIPLGHLDGQQHSVEQYAARNAEWFPYSYAFNVAGWPSLAVPVREPGALPGSVQLSAPWGAERQLLALAEPIVAPTS